MRNLSTTHGAPSNNESSKILLAQARMVRAARQQHRQGMMLAPASAPRVLQASPMRRRRSDAPGRVSAARHQTSQTNQPRCQGNLRRWGCHHSDVMCGSKSHRASLSFTYQERTHPVVLYLHVPHRVSASLYRTEPTRSLEDANRAVIRRNARRVPAPTAEPNGGLS